MTFISVVFIIKDNRNNVRIIELSINTGGYYIMLSTVENYKIALYLRLSRDDKNGNMESMSIDNQRKFLIAYVHENGWEVSEIYTDDGYSGTTFERPSFLRMIEDIKAGKINMVVTKDLSRLGRNYVMTGQYTDFFFPKYHVRYIAVNDNYDSRKDDNDIAPFKNILNEMYAKDISKKVRTSRIINAKQGKYMGSQPPYGYLKSPLDKHVLIPDPAVRDIVAYIFDEFAKGQSGRHIAQVLNERKILAPRAYYYQRIGGENPHPEERQEWGSTTIMQILKNRVYIGDLVQGKRTALSFKSKQRISTKQEDWIVCENTHEALVEKSVWEEVQHNFGKPHYRATKSTGEVSLFSGVVRCADCGASLSFTNKICGGRTYQLYKCSNYANHGKTVCSIHSISLPLLEAVILRDIRYHAQLIQAEEQAVISQVFRMQNKNNEQLIERYQTNIHSGKERLKEIDSLYPKLFEEKQRGNITAAVFKKLMSDYEAEQEKIQTQTDALSKELSTLEKNLQEIPKWTDAMKKYTSIQTLTRNIVLELIDSIEVSEQYIKDGSKQQDIIINYKFVGNMGRKRIADKN